MGEEEEDVDEEDEEALGEEEEGDGEIFLFVVTQPRHFVLHIPNTPPHHHLCSTKKGANRDRLRQFEKYPNPNARNARPIPYYPQNDRTSVDKTKKKYPKRWCFLSNKTKKNPFFPHLKQKKKKKKKKTFFPPLKKKKKKKKKKK